MSTFLFWDYFKRVTPCTSHVIDTQEEEKHNPVCLGCITAVVTVTVIIFGKQWWSASSVSDSRKCLCVWYKETVLCGQTCRAWEGCTVFFPWCIVTIINIVTDFPLRDCLSASRQELWTLWVRWQLLLLQRGGWPSLGRQAAVGSCWLATSMKRLVILTPVTPVKWKVYN